MLGHTKKDDNLNPPTGTNPNPGNNYCHQMLHMPHCDVKMVPFNVAVVYRMNRNQLGFAVFVRGFSSETEFQKKMGEDILSCKSESNPATGNRGGPIENAESVLRKKLLLTN